MIQFQMQQAAEARQREAERQARLNQGKAAIDAIFEPSQFDALYNRYQQAALDYSLPQLQQQYQKARDQTTYDLARAGTLRSSIAGTSLADIETQRAINEAGIRAKAEGDVAQLRSNIGGQKQSALSQLYATEDPDVAANTATSMVQQANLQTPNLNPLGELFKPLVIGTTTGLTNYLDTQNFNTALERARRNAVAYTQTT